jgi:hypothetical protein
VHAFLHGFGQFSLVICQKLFDFVVRVVANGVDLRPESCARSRRRLIKKSLNPLPMFRCSSSSGLISVCSVGLSSICADAVSFQMTPQRMSMPPSATETNVLSIYSPSTSEPAVSEQSDLVPSFNQIIGGHQ